MSDTQTFILIGMGMIMLWILGHAVIAAWIEVQKHRSSLVAASAEADRREVSQLTREQLAGRPYDQEKDRA